MAIGGALRAAIRAGRFNVAGRESRRQARALASLNEGGPLGGRTGSPFPFPGPERGFDPARFGGQAFGESSRGAAVVVDSNTGRRVVLPQSFDDFMAGTPMARGPIASPFEGFRAAGYDPNYSMIGGLERVGGEMSPIPRAFRAPVPFSPRPLQLQPPRRPQISTMLFDDFA